MVNELKNKLNKRIFEFLNPQLIKGPAKTIQLINYETMIRMMILKKKQLEKTILRATNISGS